MVVILTIAIVCAVFGLFVSVMSLDIKSAISCACVIIICVTMIKDHSSIIEMKARISELEKEHGKVVNIYQTESIAEKTVFEGKYQKVTIGIGSITVFYFQGETEETIFADKITDVIYHPCKNRDGYIRIITKDKQINVAFHENEKNSEAEHFVEELNKIR